MNSSLLGLEERLDDDTYSTPHDNRKVTRSSLVRRGVSLAGALFLAACSQEETPKTKSDLAAQALQSPSPKVGAAPTIAPTITPTVPPTVTNTPTIAPTNTRPPSPTYSPSATANPTNTPRPSPTPLTLKPSSLIWSYKLQSPINSIDYGAILSGGKYGVVAGAADGHVYLFSAVTGEPSSIIDLSKYQSRVNVSRLTYGTDIQKVVVDKYIPNRQDILIATTLNWILVTPEGEIQSPGNAVTGWGGVASLLATGDNRGNGLKSILFSTTSSCHGWIGILLSYYPFVHKPSCESFPENVGANQSLVTGRRGESLAMSISSGLFADIDVDGKDEIFYVGSDGYLYMLRGSTNVWRHRISGAIGKYFLTAADVNRDKKPDIIVGAPDGNMYALKGTTGEPIWTTRLPNSVTSVTNCDVNGDGISDILVGSADGRIYALNGLDGRQLWNFNTVGYPLNLSHYVTSDGACYVITGSGDGNIYVVRNNGTKLLTYPAGSPVFDLKLGDIRGDKLTYMLFGTKAGLLGLYGPLESLAK